MSQQFFEYAKARGLKQTEQRRAIVETFLRSRGHLNIEELLGRVRRDNPRIGYATVYRTLKLLLECGLANARHFGDGLTRYELADADHHDHLICSSCGDIVEFKNDTIEDLQEQIAREHGFEIHSHKMELYGVCPRCRASRTRSAGETGAERASAQERRGEPGRASRETGRGAMSGRGAGPGREPSRPSRGRRARPGGA